MTPGTSSQKSAAKKNRLLALPAVELSISDKKPYSGWSERKLAYRPRSVIDEHCAATQFHPRD